MIDIILVNPQMGENIGAAARAMANFGLKNLILINPRDGWPNKAAEANSVGAFEHLNDIKVFETLKEAIAPYQVIFATTARPRDMRKKVFTPQKAIENILKENARTAVIFGGERAGLSNDDIARAHHIITFPTNENFSSLNLAQSVLLICAEYARQNLETDEQTLPTGKSELVSTEELNKFFDRLDAELEKGQFFRNQDMKPTMMNNIRSLFTRAYLTDQEVKTLHGIVSSLISNKTN
ncbi:MAG: RNA methyltransferase [Pseudomonadota bacterium]